MTSTARISDRVSEQLVRMVCRNASRALLPLLLAIGLSVLVLHDNVDAAALKLWAGLTCAVMLVRILLLRRVADAPALSQPRKRLATGLLSFCAGTAFATVLVFFPDVPPFDRAMLTAILLGVCSGAVASNSGYRPLFLCYALPMLGSLGTLWIVNPGTALDPTLAIAIGVSVLLVVSTLAITAQDVFDAFALSVESSVTLEQKALELSRALGAAEDAQSRAEMTSESKTRFIAAASHDLRQPVHVLNLYAAALKSIDTEPKVRSILDDMAVAVDSLSSQIDTLLDLSALDCGTVEPEMQAVDLSHLVGDLEREFVKLAEDKGIRLLNRIDESMDGHVDGHVGGRLCVDTDPDMLCQILRNLCGNAIKFTHHGSVSIMAEARGDERIALSIVDTGIGMQTEDSHKVFEEFYQACNEGRDRRQGIGLGLSIVERLVNRLGHAIELDSTLGVGTRATVVMHRRASDSPAGSEPLAPDPITEPVRLPAGFWLHLVDDDDAVRRGMQALLRSLGHEVTVSESTEETLAFLTGRSPSAVLVDLRLRDGDSGLRVVDALSRTHPHVPLALITGEVMDDRNVTERYPDLLVLQKPVPEQELLELLGYMVGMPAADDDDDGTSPEPTADGGPSTRLPE